MNVDAFLRVVWFCCLCDHCHLCCFVCVTQILLCDFAVFRLKKLLKQKMLFLHWSYPKQQTQTPLPFRMNLSQRQHLTKVFVMLLLFITIVYIINLYIHRANDVDGWNVKKSESKTERERAKKSVSSPNRKRKTILILKCLADIWKKKKLWSKQTERNIQIRREKTQEIALFDGYHKRKRLNCSINMCLLYTNLLFEKDHQNIKITPNSSLFGVYDWQIRC